MTPTTHPARAARQAIRCGPRPLHTSGVAPGYVQANVVILERRWAGDFLRYCQRNPKPCPLLAVSEPGDPSLPELGDDIDLRTDVPRYRIWRDGVLAETTGDITALWRDDFVSFAIGCSFSFEQALIEQGLPLRHVAQGRNVAMFTSTIQTTPAGPFAGPMVVSMRPLRAASAISAIQLTARFPSAHGAPVHIGAPSLIGIANVMQPDEGDAIEVRSDELPVFWACGVTPQLALRAARLPLAITHAPGAMLITDLMNHRLLNY